MLPRQGDYADTAMIAVALKSNKVNLITLMPNASAWEQIQTINLNEKPTCLIQLSCRHLAVAVGSLKEKSVIQIYDMHTQKLTSKLEHHTDMIDSMIQVHFLPNNTKSKNNQIQWLLSASRDHRIVLWKLLAGMLMTKSEISPFSPSRFTSKTVNNRAIMLYKKKQLAIQ